MKYNLHKYLKIKLKNPFGKIKFEYLIVEVYSIVIFLSLHMIVL